MTTVETKFHHGLLSEIAALWDLRLSRVHSEIQIAGSPERSEFRVVVETDIGDLFILEQIFRNSLNRKRHIAKILDHLESSGLASIIAYRKSRAGGHILGFDGSFWQIQRFFPGVELDRPAYAFEKWRGKVLADFLIGLHRNILSMKEEGARTFSLKHYISRLMGDVQRCDPQYLGRIEPAFYLLKRVLFPVYDDLPVGFCHGDYHPVNVLWTPQGIGAVIDWEFCGIKSELYDAANMVGCLGIEHPDSLTADCVLRFIYDLKASGLYAQQGWDYFFELLLAIRFGWMAEWLRKKDLEMIEMECDYWDILMNNREQLKMIWKI